MKQYDIICNKFVYPVNMHPITYLTTLNTITNSYIHTFMSHIRDEAFRQYVIDEWNTAKEFCACNMFIGKRSIIEQYMIWLFTILADIATTEFRNKLRVIGYMTEFLFGFWLKYNKCKITYETVNCYNNTLTKLEQVNHR